MGKCRIRLFHHPGVTFFMFSPRNESVANNCVETSFFGDVLPRLRVSNGGVLLKPVGARPGAKSPIRSNTAQQDTGKETYFIFLRLWQKKILFQLEIKV